MVNEVKISVIVPVYNVGELVARAVGSVCMQDFDSYEVILVDDGSTDESGKICDELASEYECIRVMHKENGGVSSARNAGLYAAHGEYVMFLDADDAIRDGSLSLMYGEDCDMVLGGFEKLDGSSVTASYRPSSEAMYVGNERMCTFFDRNLASRNTYLLNSACFKLFRRSLIVKHQLRFIENLSFAEDKMFVMSFLSHADSVRTVPQTVYSYILQEGSLSSDMSSDRHLRQVFVLLKAYAPLLKQLEVKYSGSRRIMKLYHRDFVGRYVCRILTAFASGRSELLSRENISELYRYMDADKSLGVFSIRMGQIPNVVLYKIGRHGLAVSFYRCCAFFAELFGR
ncbi:MAG: glycosyltransferase [Bacteroidales bacterium]|nr:glycosyltransferase [Bacteroidales bacterium]